MARRLIWRDRFMLLAKILLEETDPQHPISLSQLMNKLEKLGVPAERKSLYADLRALNEHGFGVVYSRAKGGYYIESRPLTQEDLALLLDAVAVYPYLTDDQRTSITKKLQGFASAHQRTRLNRPVCVQGGKDKTTTEGVQKALGCIYTAMRDEKVLSFVLLDFDAKLLPVSDNSFEVVSPKGLLWADGGYQLLGWDHHGGKLRLYRLNRMEKTRILSIPAAGPEADPSLWAKQTFGTDISRRERVKIRCNPEMAGDVVDKFGREAQVEVVENGFILTADVIVGPEFWAWMYGHREEVELISPLFMVTKSKLETWGRGAV